MPVSDVTHAGPSDAGSPQAIAPRQEQFYAMLCHLAGFAGYVIPVVGWIVGPLVVWLAKKDDSAFIDYHGREAINFQISCLLYWIPVICLCFVLIGFVLIPILAIFHIVVMIVAAIRANDGKRYRCPLCIRFL